MDRISPSEGGDAGSIPAEGTDIKTGPCVLFLCLFVFKRGIERRGGPEGKQLRPLRLPRHGGVNRRLFRTVGSESAANEVSEQ